MTTTTLPPRVAVLPAVLVVKVTDEDGLLGVRRDPYGCRFARAINRTLALQGYQIDEVIVGSSHLDTAVVSVGVAYGPTWLYELDGPAADQVYEYDNGGNPPPCTVTLRLMA